MEKTFRTSLVFMILKIDYHLKRGQKIILWQEKDEIMVEVQEKEGD